MSFIVETKLPDYENWYPAIDPDKSKVHPEKKIFATQELAEEWAKKYVPKHHEWRVIEDEVQ